MLLWNKINGGHDIRIGGQIVHSIKATDFATPGTISQKEKAISEAADAEITFTELKTVLHIENLSPLRYTLWLGPQEEKLPAKWWEKTDNADI